MTEWIILPWNESFLELAGRIKEADCRELRASHGIDPLTGLCYSVKNSEKAYGISLHGRIEGAFGWAHIDDEQASPWMLTSQELCRTDSNLWIRNGRKWIRIMHQQYDILRNYVDIRNKHSLRWLRLIGFVAGPAIPFGIEGQLFREMTSCVSRY